MPKTNAEKLRERSAELEQLARSLGFENYSQLSTYLKNQHRAGQPIKIVVGSGKSSEVIQSGHPSRTPLG
jgi:50S ribosomal subunit-associated GTPase HflX